MTEKKGIQAKSADTMIVENRLRSTEIGDIVTYDDLSKILGRDVREFCLGSIATARKALIGESIFFDTISKEGYKRLSQEEACGTAKHYVSRVKSAASRGMKHLQNVKFAELSDDAQKKHLTTSAQLGAISLFSSANSEKKIEKRITTSSGPIAIGETLALFGGVK